MTDSLSQSHTSLLLLLLVAVIIVCYLTGFTLRRLHSKFLHESATSILIGLIVGALVRFFSPSQRYYSLIEFDSEIFFLLLLPPIIFESGYNLNKRVFFRHLVSICAYAFLGTIISSLVFGASLWGISLSGLFNTQFSLIECLVFGALISSTDPVTVLSIFKELRVDVHLYIHVLGESCLNDAVAIVLYQTLILELKVFSSAAIVRGLFNFFFLLLGSLLIGMVVALLAALLFRYSDLHKNSNVELVLLLLYSYSSYLLADGMNLSGIVSILACGITMAHYTRKNLSPETKNAARDMFEMLASLSETFVFCYMGLSMLNILPQFDFYLILVSLVLMLFTRALHIFPLAWLMNGLHLLSRKIPFAHQFMMWFAGLRGAMAFALAYELKSLTPNGDVFLTTTVILVLVTVLVMGGATSTTLKCLKIKCGDITTEQESDYADHKIGNWFLKIDNNYLKPFFCRGADVEETPPSIKCHEPSDLELQTEIEVVLEV